MSTIRVLIAGYRGKMGQTAQDALCKKIFIHTNQMLYLILLRLKLSKRTFSYILTSMLNLLLVLVAYLKK